MAPSTTFELRIPTTLIQLGLDRQTIQSRLTEWLIFTLFTESKISSGKAASLLGIDRVRFLALLRERGISYINYTDDELEEEFAAVEALQIEVNNYQTSNTDY